jgi:DNA replication licensing factor MCM4
MPSRNDAPETFVWTSELIDSMKRIGRDPNVYNNLVHSIAPNVWECDDVKKGIICVIFFNVK